MSGDVVMAVSPGTSTRAHVTAPGGTRPHRLIAWGADKQHTAGREAAQELAAYFLLSRLTSASLVGVADILTCRHGRRLGCGGLAQGRTGSTPRPMRSQETGPFTPPAPTEAWFSPSRHDRLSRCPAQQTRTQSASDLAASVQSPGASAHITIYSETLAPRTCVPSLARPRGPESTIARWRSM